MEKLLRVWIQSFLAGVPVILIGFRDRNGVLVRTDRLETLRIPSLVRDFAARTAPADYGSVRTERFGAHMRHSGPKQSSRTDHDCWEATVCLNFTERVLSFVARCLQPKVAQYAAAAATGTSVASTSGPRGSGSGSGSGSGECSGPPAASGDGRRYIHFLLEAAPPFYGVCLTELP